MNLTEFLNSAEVRKLSGGESTLNGQVRALRANGVPHKVVGGRVLLVSRHHAREWLAGRVVAPSNEPKLERVK